MVRDCLTIVTHKKHFIDGIHRLSLNDMGVADSSLGALLEKGVLTVRESEFGDQVCDVKWSDVSWQTKQRVLCP